MELKVILSMSSSESEVSITIFNIAVVKKKTRICYMYKSGKRLEYVIWYKRVLLNLSELAKILNLVVMSSFNSPL